jgi:hypothetical protein
MPASPRAAAILPEFVRIAPNSPVRDPGSGRRGSDLRAR